MQFESRWEKQQRLKRQKRSSVAGMITAVILVLLLGVAMWTLEKKNRIYEEQSESLTQQINEQQQRQKELEEYKKYVKTKKFVEEVAKNKFGLLYPDEILIKPDD